MSTGTLFPKTWQKMKFWMQVIALHLRKNTFAAKKSFSIKLTNL
jgi:hypothetical protein